MEKTLTKVDQQLILEINAQAIKKVEGTYGNLATCEAKPAAVMSYLKVCGLRCMSCGSQNISHSTFKFFGFTSNVFCWDCQGRVNSNFAPEYAS